MARELGAKVVTTTHLNAPASSEVTPERSSTVANSCPSSRRPTLPIDASATAR